MSYNAALGKRELADMVERGTKGAYHLTTYSPGDGQTRYKIVAGDADYFGGRDIVSALGLSEARVMVSAFLSGWFERTRD